MFRRKLSENDLRNMRYDTTLRSMYDRGVPLTRYNYISWRYCDCDYDPEQVLPPEVEFDLPSLLACDEEYTQGPAPNYRIPRSWMKKALRLEPKEPGPYDAAVKNLRGTIACYEAATKRLPRTVVMTPYLYSLLCKGAERATFKGVELVAVVDSELLSRKTESQWRLIG